MSKQSIADKAQIIRNETQQYANTRGRVADVLDDINETKADKTELQAAVTDNLKPLQDALAKEISDRSTAVQDEATARADGDSGLNNKISKNTTDISTHIADKSNPHTVTKGQVGLSNVDNTSDAKKPISDAQQVALDKKLDKTTTTVSAPDAVNKYVYLTTEDNSLPKRMLAGDLGKNVANSALTSVANAGLNLGANWMLNANNFGLYFTGLADKSADSTFYQVLVQNTSGQVAKSNGKPVIEGLLAALPLNKDAAGNYDNSFSEYLVRNPTTGLIKRSDRPQIISNFTVPSTINVTYPTTIANSNYTPAPTTPQDIADTFNMIKNLETGYQFITVTPDMWILKTMDAAKIAPYSSWTVPTDINQTILPGTLYLKEFYPPTSLTNDLNFTNSVVDENSFWGIYLNKEFPTDKDWILRIRVHDTPNPLLFNERGAFWGFVNSIANSNNTPKNQTDIIAHSYRLLWEGMGGGTIGPLSGDGYLHRYYMYFIKKGSKISIFVYNYFYGNMAVNTIDYQNFMKFFRIGTYIAGPQKILPGALQTTYLTDIAYWIQP